jgi:predicted adenylyl cyclase CyaB
MKSSRNIELKARVHALAATRQIAVQVATAHLGTQRQTDTYFRCSHGRLKLREMDGQPAQLIGYLRSDENEAKVSDYRILAIEDATAARCLLSASLGVLVVVSKRREIFLHQNVRIHLDEVDDLGAFLEFEAVLGNGVDEEAGRRQLADLRDRFAIVETDLIQASYSDLILAQS